MRRLYVAQSGRMERVNLQNALVATLVAIAARPVLAQTTLTAGYEIHRDRFHYTFENPSNIDTEFLVPHSFTQTYDADNQWIAAAVRVPVGADHMEAGF